MRRIHSSLAGSRCPRSSSMPTSYCAVSVSRSRELSRNSVRPRISMSSSSTPLAGRP
ncbi:hypothetical protein ACFQZ4_40410 [Catellatospora coxensis]